MIHDPVLLTLAPRIVHAVTTRFGGWSEGPYASLNLGLHVGDRRDTVLRNRMHVCRRLGFRLDDWVSGEQVHDVEVARVDALDRGRGARSTASAVPGVDGLITATPGLLLVTMVADCYPVVFVDPAIPAVGIAHAGWRGTLDGIVLRMVKRMQEEFGTDPKRLHVWLGPGIGRCCFAVDAALAERFAGTCGDAVVHRRGERHYVDLIEANRSLLRRAGVPETAIRSNGQCTMCHADRFFSHRREGPVTGRMAGLVGISA